MIESIRSPHVVIALREDDSARLLRAITQAVFLMRLEAGRAAEREGKPDAPEGAVQHTMTNLAVLHDLGLKLYAGDL